MPRDNALTPGLPTPGPRRHHHRPAAGEAAEAQRPEGLREAWRHMARDVEEPAEWGEVEREEFERTRARWLLLGGIIRAGIINAHVHAWAEGQGVGALQQGGSPMQYS